MRKYAVVVMLLCFWTTSQVEAQNSNCQYILNMLICGMACGFIDPVQAQEWGNYYNTYCINQPPANRCVQVPRPQYDVWGNHIGYSYETVCQ
jgi:hypothetical protein